MIPTIRKILYATDLSENSEQVFAYAINSARMHNAEIVILHVIEPIPSHIRALVDSTILGDGWIEKEQKAAVAVITKKIRAFVEREFGKNPEGVVPIKSIIVEHGYPPELILKKADEMECDIIIMGTHSKGRISHAFLGSVAEKVLRRIRKPVFIISF